MVPPALSPPEELPSWPGDREDPWEAGVRPWLGRPSLGLVITNLRPARQLLEGGMGPQKTARSLPRRLGGVGSVWEHREWLQGMPGGRSRRMRGLCQILY